MSGHSKWATTKHKKAAIDAKRGKLFAKLIKNIEIAARMGGGDPDGNPSLYDAIYKAKKASMPADNIKRAVKRGSGEEAGGANYEDIVYEGYAPAGVGLIIECLTDNRNRAAAEVRSTLTKGNGSLATSGSVSFNFERKGQIIVPAEGVDFDDLFEKAAEAGAEDVTDDGDVFTVVTGPSEMIDVRKALQDAGFDYDSADLVMMPKNEASLITTIALITYVAFIFASVHLSDKFGRKKMLITACVCFIVFTIPAFILMSTANFVTVLVVELIMCLILTINDGTLSSYLSETFPTQVRYSGFALSFNMANALFGGTASFICTSLITATGSTLAPAFYMVAVSCVALVAMIMSHEHSNKDLSEI